MAHRDPPTDAPQRPTRRPGAAAALLQALLIAGLGGSFVGALDALAVLRRVDVRYAQWGAGVVLVGVLASAAVGLLLALPATVLALVLWGRPGHHTTSPGTCGGLGVVAGLGAFVLAGSLSMAMLGPLVCGGTLAVLALRELLGWWTLPGRAATWWVLGTLATAAAGLRVAASVGEGAAATAAIALCAAACVCALGVRVLVGRLGHLPVMAGGCALALGGLVVLLRAPYPHPQRSPGTGPNVLHVSIDTLRADRVGCNGYAAAHTPVIDRLAAEGVLFADTTAQANTTGPSHTTQLTGLYPVEHGALYNGRPLYHAVRTLPQRLADAGWQTAGFVSGFTMVDAACGLAPRFDWYGDDLLSWTWMPQAAEELVVVDRVLFRLAARRGEWVTRADRPAGETVDEALDWLAHRPLPGAPFYAFVHLYDPHAPYEPPGEDAGGYDWYAAGSAEREAIVTDPQRRARMNALYDGEVAYADEQVGRLLEALRASGELEHTLVILTSDHGEGFGSHDYWFDHGTYLFDEELHVPLILRLPGGAHAGERIAEQTRLLDLMPTVLELAGVEGEARTSGTSLVPLVEGGRGERPPAETADRPSFALAEMAGNISGFDVIGRRVSLRARGHKLIWTSSYWNDTTRVAERYELYDLAADPDEQHDLWPADPADPEFAPSMRDQLDTWRRALEDAAGGDAPLSAEVAEKLRQLGYL